MIRYITLFCCLGLLFSSGCSTVQKSSTASPTGSRYQEDLSSTRPKLVPANQTTVQDKTVKRDVKAYVEPQYTVNKQVDTVLDSINRINLTRRFIDGYTIQVYSGQKREEALNVKKDLLIYLPKIESDVQYNQPNFRVKAGKYYTQLDAQKDYQQVKQYFPSAIVVPDRIPIN
jgi:hypothetical protein